MENHRFSCHVCRSTHFLEGPHGGHAIHFACAGCWARYNDLGPFGIDRDGWVLPVERRAFHDPYVPRSRVLRHIWAGPEFPS